VINAGASAHPNFVVRFTAVSDGLYMFATLHTGSVYVRVNSTDMGAACNVGNVQDSYIAHLATGDEISTCGAAHSLAVLYLGNSFEV